MVKESIETILVAPKLLKGVVELVAKSPSKLADMIKGSIQILKHGPEVAEEAFSSINKLDSESFASIFKNADDFDDVSSGIVSLNKVGIRVGNLPYGQADNLKFLEKFGETLKKFDRMPPNAIKKIEFVDMEMGGIYHISSKIIEFPTKNLPAKNIIAHELGHAESLKRLSDKISNVNPDLAKDIDEAEEVTLTYIRGFSETLADYRAYKNVDGFPLDNFFIGAKNSKNNIDLWSKEGPKKLHDYFVEKRRPRTFISQYYTYIRTVAKQTGRNDVVENIDDFLKDSGNFPGQAPELIIELSGKFENNLNILEKPADIASKEVDDIIQLGKKIATEMVQNG